MGGSVELVNFSASYFSQYFLALVRVLAAMSLNPLFGSQRIPIMMRIVPGLFFTLAIFPPGKPQAGTIRLDPLSIAGELLIGLLAGFAVALVFASFQICAAIVSANSINLGGIFDPRMDMGSNAIEQLFGLLAVLLFLQTDGHHLFLAGLQRLFVTVPLGHVPTTLHEPEILGILVGSIFTAAVQMALPCLAALLLADVALGILARVAPQLNLLAMGLPIKVLVVLGALTVALPWMMAPSIAAFRGVPETLTSVAR